MPKIDDIIGDGHDLEDWDTARVLSFLQKHPDHVFSMCKEDLDEIHRWLKKPDLEEPPPDRKTTHLFEFPLSCDRIKRALSTLHERRKIGSVERHRRTFYGSHEAIGRVQKASRD